MNETTTPNPITIDSIIETLIEALRFGYIDHLDDVLDIDEESLYEIFVDEGEYDHIDISDLVSLVRGARTEIRRIKDLI